MARASHRPALLVILDGFAFGDPGHVCNAVELAATPTFDRLRRECPWTELRNNGPDVGLPPGQMGNSEVGHLNIGAGRIVYQDFMRINNDIRDGVFGKRLEPAFAHVRTTGGRLHVMGLLGPGGVHAHENHMGAALKAAVGSGIPAQKIWVHPVLDGRDTPPRSALGFLRTLNHQLGAAGIQHTQVADVIGRYYAMDRDNRWDRIETAYNLYTRAPGWDAETHGGFERSREGSWAARAAGTAEQAVEAAYRDGHAADKVAGGLGDEFVLPIVLEDTRQPYARGGVHAGDAVVWLNFRPDRSRQMTRAFMDPDFKGFARTKIDDLVWVCMTQYDAEFANWPGVHVAYPPQTVPDCLAEQLAKLGLTQFHIAETEKYAHVTYFLNGGREAAFAGEDRVLVPSPKVATYDLKPEMSAGEVTDKLLHAMGSGGHDLYVVNFANPDMVGHTGKLKPTVAAVEFTDQCVNRLVSTATGLGMVTLITSDHGNAEEMCKPNADGSPGEPVTKHTMNPSPLIAVNAGPGVRLRPGGRLENVSPTLLDLMGLPIPAAMTARSLVERA